MPEPPATADGGTEPSCGDLAVRENLVTPQQIKECLDLQTRLRLAGIEPKSLTEILVEKGYLGADQAARLQQMRTEPPAPEAPAPVPAPEPAPPAASASPTPTPAISDPAAQALDTAPGPQGRVAGGDAPLGGAAPSQGQATRSRPASSANLLKIPGYEFLNRIGQGAMGTVFKARQISMDRLVAIKILSPKYGKDRNFVERFVREARAVARLNHENVIAGIDVGESNGFHFFVMEYVDGEPLSHVLKREGRLDEKRCVRIGLQIARALEHAERNSLIHRDVKPENIMMTRDGVAKLCDLGLAKQTKQDGANLTQEGFSVGTPNYISPEQARGEDVDIRTDIYSLGASLYHVATGTPPFEGPNPMVIMTKHVTDAVQPPMLRCPSVSEGFNRLILKMMAKRRDERHANVAALIADLDAISAGKTPSSTVRPASRSGTRRLEAKSDTRETPLRVHAPVPRRTSLLPYLVAAGAVLALGVGAVLVFGRKNPEPPPAVQPDRKEAAGTQPKEEGTPSTLEEKHKFDVKTYRGYCRTRLETNPKNWVREIVQRGEEYKREYARTPYEDEWIKLVEEIRGEINRLVNERVWKALKAEIEKARSVGNYAEALRKARELDPELAEFTDAGREQREIVKEIERDQRQAYIDEKGRVALLSKEGKYDEAYRTLGEMLAKYGEEKALELRDHREQVLRDEIARVLSDPLTPAKFARAGQRLRDLQTAFERDAEFLRLLSRMAEEVRARSEKVGKEAAARAGEAFKREVAPGFEKALAGRDLLAARRALFEFWAGERYAMMHAAVFGGAEFPLLASLLDPQRATTADSRTVGALETAAKEAQSQGRPVAFEFLLCARACALVEGLVDLTLAGTEILNRDQDKYRKCSDALKNVVEGHAVPRGAGDPWKLHVKRSVGGTMEEDLAVAPRTQQGLTPLADADLVALARRAPSDGYLPLRIALLFLYAGQLAEAASWLEQVKDAGARFAIERYLDRVRNIPSPAKEKEAKARYAAATKAFSQGKKAEALKLLKELRDSYANTEYLTTTTDEDGSQMAETRLKIVLIMIAELETRKDKKKASVEDLFKGTVKLTGTRIEADYDFSGADATADFVSVNWIGGFQAAKEEKGVRLKGTGFWYWKAPLKGAVTVETTVRMAADQGVGAIVHGEGTVKGYLAMADFEGTGPLRNVPPGAVLFRLPATAAPREWQKFVVQTGGRKIDLKRDGAYAIKLVRQGNACALYVNNQEVVGVANHAEYSFGLAGVALITSEAVVEKIRIVGDVEKSWLDEELKKIEK
ncbi:MAG: protein kinase [Planctomycetes bacterium]|nr:protein kinase [Planctomycetota bacterium]